jgi:hypothetical protein
MTDLAGTKTDVILHVRLGDMATNTTSRNYHGLISREYIKDGLEHFDIEVKSLTLVTEDKQELEREFPGLGKSVKRCIHSQDALLDFREIIQHKKIIISNSTFSWWAAWLSNTSIVAPKQWFESKILKKNPIDDLIPENWKLL